MVETNLISFKVYKQQAGAVQIETSDSHDLCFVDMVWYWNSRLDQMTR